MYAGNQTPKWDTIKSGLEILKNCLFNANGNINDIGNAWSFAESYSNNKATREVAFKNYIAHKGMSLYFLRNNIDSFTAQEWNDNTTTLCNEWLANKNNFFTALDGEIINTLFEFSAHLNEENYETYIIDNEYVVKSIIPIAKKYYFNKFGSVQVINNIQKSPLAIKDLEEYLIIECEKVKDKNAKMAYIVSLEELDNYIDHPRNNYYVLNYYLTEYLRTKNVGLLDKITKRYNDIDKNSKMQAKKIIENSLSNSSDSSQVQYLREMDWEQYIVGK